MRWPSARTDQIGWRKSATRSSRRVPGWKRWPTVPIAKPTVSPITHHSYAPRDDTRSEATYCHDIRDRVQRAVDRVLVTAQILLTEGAEGFTHQIDLLGTGQRRYAGFTAVAGGQDGTFRLLASR